MVVFGTHLQLQFIMMLFCCQHWCHRTQGVCQQLPQSQMPFLAYANYAMEPLQASSSFRIESPTNLSIYVGVCPGICFLSSGSTVDAVFNCGGSTMRVWITTAWSTPMAGICTSWWWSEAHARNALGGCSFHCLSRGAIPEYVGTYSFGVTGESHLILPPSLHGEEGSSFPGLVTPNDAVNSKSVVGMTPGDSSVVIGYQVHEFSYTWLAEHFVAHSYIYPGFMGKVSSLTHFPLEPGCEDYSFWTSQWQTLNRVWIQSSLTPSRHQNWMPHLRQPHGVLFSVLSGFLHLLSTISNTSKLQLASNI